MEERKIEEDMMKPQKAKSDKFNTLSWSDLGRLYLRTKPTMTKARKQLAKATRGKR